MEVASTKSTLGRVSATQKAMPTLGRHEGSVAHRAVAAGVAGARQDHYPLQAALSVSRVDGLFPYNPYFRKHA